MRVSRKILIFSFCLTVLAALSGTGCRSSHISDDGVVIGVLLPLSGEYETAGKLLKSGIELALEDAAKERIHSGLPPIKAVFVDNGSDRDTTRAGYVKLVTQEKADIVIGLYTSTGMLFLKSLVEQYRVPVISPVATNEEVTERTEYLFRGCYDDSTQSRAIAYFPIVFRKKTRLGVMISLDAQAVYSRDLGRKIAEAFRDFQGTVVGMEGFRSNDDSYKKALRQLLETNPDVIAVPALPDMAVKIVLEARNLGFTGLLIGGDSWDSPDFYDRVGSNIGDAFFVSMFSPQYDDAKTRNFVARMTDKNGEQPGTLEAQGYDTTMLAVNALKISYWDGKSVADSIRSIRNFRGVTGKTTIEGDGSVVKNIFVQQLAPNYAGQPVVRRLSTILDGERIRKRSE